MQHSGAHLAVNQRLDGWIQIAAEGHASEPPRLAETGSEPIVSVSSERRETLLPIYEPRVKDHIDDVRLAKLSPRDGR